MAASPRLNRKSGMPDTCHNVGVIGGGIVGMAAAMALVSRFRASLAVFEAEDHVATHQTGHNSGVIHSGLYYKPGSLKADLCVRGRNALYRFCEDHAIAHERCGKLVIATEPSEMPLLEELARRGAANGVQGIRTLDAERIKEYEPHAAGLGGLWVPETGIVDYTAVANAYADVARAHGAEIITAARVLRVERRCNEFVLTTAKGEYRCRAIINTAGLHCDRVARLCGVLPNVKIIPFRGEYHTLVPERQHMIRNLIYPVPDPRFPFLGVHFTWSIHGGVEAGPNAVLAFKREGYTKLALSPRDTFETLAYAGFWRMGRTCWREGMGEMYRSLNKASFARRLARLVPGVKKCDLTAGGSGVRAQAVDSAGRMLDDFHIIEAEQMIHVLNAPSPAATASIAIGEAIARLAHERFSLGAPRT